MIRAAATITQSLRVRNPSVRVANSIYHPANHANPAFVNDVTSVVAPSELEFEFDDMIITSQAYRRAMAHAQAKITPPSSQDDAALGDLIDLTDELTIRQQEDTALPSALQELQVLIVHRPPTRDQTTEGCADQRARQTATAAEETLTACSPYQAIFEALEFSDAAFPPEIYTRCTPFPSRRSPRQRPRQCQKQHSRQNGWL